MKVNSQKLVDYLSQKLDIDEVLDELEEIVADRRKKNCEKKVNNDSLIDTDNIKDETKENYIIDTVLTENSEQKITTSTSIESQGKKCTPA